MMCYRKQRTLALLGYYNKTSDYLTIHLAYSDDDTFYAIFNDMHGVNDEDEVDENSLYPRSLIGRVSEIPSFNSDEENDEYVSDPNADEYDSDGNVIVNDE